MMPKLAGKRAMSSSPSSPPVIAIGLQRNGPEDLAEGDGQQREVDAAPV